jgi:hypothetical protein
VWVESTPGRGSTLSHRSAGRLIISSGDDHSHPDPVARQRLFDRAERRWSDQQYRAGAVGQWLAGDIAENGAHDRGSTA